MSFLLHGPLTRRQCLAVRCKPFHLDLVRLLHRLGQFVGRLKPVPSLGTAAERLVKTNRHFRRNARAAIHNIRKLLTADAGHSHCPRTREIAPQRMEPETWQVHIPRLSCFIKTGKNPLDLGDQPGETRFRSPFSNQRSRPLWRKPRIIYGSVTYHWAVHN